MHTLTDIELESLLAAVESDRSERKRAWSGDAPDKGCQAVCAFANDLPNCGKPGVLFVGVEDDGLPSQIPITDELLQTLAGIKSSGDAQARSEVHDGVDACELTGSGEQCTA